MYVPDFIQPDIWPNASEKAQARFQMVGIIMAAAISKQGSNYEHDYEETARIAVSVTDQIFKLLDK